MAHALPNMAHALPNMAHALPNVAEPKSYDGGFFRAILAVHGDRHDEAQQWIDTARSALHPQARDLAPRDAYPT
eukprot:4349831-Prymnesium_polylepis.2